MLKSILSPSSNSPSNIPTKKGGGFFSPWNPIGWIFFLGFSLPGIAITIGAAFYNLTVLKQLTWEKSTAMVGMHVDSLKDVEGEDDIYYTYSFDREHYEIDGYGRDINFFDTESIDARDFARKGSREQDVPVWINPQNPSESTIAPNSIDWTAYFLAIFAYSHGLTGIAMLCASIRGARSTRGLDTRIAANPDDPLSWRDDWSRGRAEYRRHGWLIPLGYAALVAIIVIWWTTVSAWLTPSSGAVRLVGLGVSAIGILPVYLFWRTWRKTRLSRQTQLHFPSGGLTIGEENEITIRSRYPLSHQKWQITCTDCQHSTSQNTSNDDERFKFEGQVSSQTIEGTKVRFHLPAYAPLTSSPNSDYTGINWTVEGGGTGPYTIPVLRVSDKVDDHKSSYQSPTEFPPINLPETKAEALDVLAAEKITYLESGDDHLLEIPAGRHKGGASVTLIVGAIFFTIATIVVVNNSIDFFLIIWALLFGGGGLFMAGTGLILLAQKSVLGRFERSQEIRVEKTLFGIRRSVSYPIKDVESIQSEESWQSGSTQFYKLSLNLKTDAGTKEKKLADSILSRTAAEVMAKIMNGESF